MKRMDGIHVFKTAINIITVLKRKTTGFSLLGITVYLAR